MSDEEKKAFFNKIDAAWKGKGEKNERFGRGVEGPTFGSADEQVDELTKAQEKLPPALKKAIEKKEKNESFADPLEGFPQAYKDLLKKLQRSNDRGERHMLINKMNVIRKKLKLKPLTNESVNEASMKYIKK